MRGHPESVIQQKKKRPPEFPRMAALLSVTPNAGSERWHHSSPTATSSAGVTRTNVGGAYVGDFSSSTTCKRLYAGRPVPAGMSRPMMTFSLMPRRSSVLPQIAASVRTLVVSWKDDALMKDSVDSDAFVIPSNIGSATASL